MNNLHKIDKVRLDKKLYICIIFLGMYGIYKNGLVLKFYGYGSILNILKLLILPVITFLVAEFYDRLFKNNDLYNSKILGFLFLLGIPFKTNLFIYLLFLIVILYGYNFLIKKHNLSFNSVALFHVLFILILLLFNNYEYQNTLELAHEYEFTLVDSLFGRNVSGIYISNIFLIILSFIFFSFTYYYKKIIPLISILTYYLSLIIFALITNNLSIFMGNMLVSNILFALVFIAPISLYTPTHNKEEIIYSISLGIFTLVFSLLINFYEGVYIAILISNLLMILLNYLPNKILKSKK